MKKKTIDVQDIAILNILAEHAELNNKDLAARIDLSEGSTLVRVQNLWKRGVIKSHAAQINFRFFGYNKFYFIRVEVTDTDADELKHRLSISRYMIIFVEIEGSIDLVMRIYIGILQTKNLKTAKDELQSLTGGLKGIRMITMNPISSISQKTLTLDDKDVIK
jgi:DNA-binding Lrp family transcriptional regulator